MIMKTIEVRVIYFIIYITLPPPETIQVGKRLIW